ncbi:hypothetical protein GCM10022392_04920 [Mucilaginibacter panaciglaebae]|uniref:Uncharacterized protein n=1 Tax=Mucilaginibacter panaciglaebae TaxID=502331 RepID=A0ABP7WDW4_9SPHI
MNKKEHVLKLIFQDWDLCEEYFQYKGIFPKQTSDIPSEEPLNARERIAKSYSKIYRIK